MLTQSRLKELLHYDPATGVFTHTAARGNRSAGAIAGSVNGWGYRHHNIDGKFYKAHRLAWLYMTGEWPALEIDHIDTDKQNNSWSNLREATRLMNQQNLRRAPSTNKSCGLLGATKFKGKWAARIKVGGKSHHLGLFDTPEEAHAAYLDAKNVLHPGAVAGISAQRGY